MVFISGSCFIVIVVVNFLLEVVIDGLKLFVLFVVWMLDDLVWLEVSEVVFEVLEIGEEVIF